MKCPELGAPYPKRYGQYRSQLLMLEFCTDLVMKFCSNINSTSISTDSIMKINDLNRSVVYISLHKV